MSPAEVLDKHTSRDLTEWMIYLGMEPTGEERADLRAGIIASTVANAHRGKGQKAFKPDDFMPRFGPEKEQTENEMRLAAQTLATAFGGRFGKGD